MSKPRRFHFSRGDITGALAAAGKAADANGKTYYVYPTAFGHTVTTIKPPRGLQHYRCLPHGPTKYHKAQIGGRG